MQVLLQIFVDYTTLYYFWIKDIFFKNIYKNVYGKFYLFKRIEGLLPRARNNRETIVCCFRKRGLVLDALAVSWWFCVMAGRPGLRRVGSTGPHSNEHSSSFILSPEKMCQNVTSKNSQLLNFRVLTVAS